MAFPRNSLRSFLQYAKRNLAEATQGHLKVNIVVGNESAGDVSPGSGHHWLH